MELLVQSLNHAFPGLARREVIRDLNLAIPAGQFTAVVGPSGCGKSTLLRILAGLVQPTSGRVLLDGLTPLQATAEQRIAWMAQSPALLPWLTAAQNVALAGRILPPGKVRLTAQDALKRVGLGDSAHAYPFMLSGGMQQRLALARTISLPADLWLMDEPFAAVDELTRERLTGELLSLWQPLGTTVIWVTHHLAEALRLADRVLVLSPRPASLVADIRVDFPHPRDEADPRFISLLKTLRKALENG
jgi:NitT/TauT family transport system ATP-binding protein